MERKKIKLGVFGFGCVGQGLYGVLKETRGVKAEIAKFCVKDRNKQRSLPTEYFTYDQNEILNDPEINVIVELIDDHDAAYKIVTSAMKKGKAVVTANKKMIADNLEELYCLQLQYRVPLLYEGACCASIPIIRNLEEYYDNDLVNAVEGIFNGSTNYILTKIFEEGKLFGEALAEAQANGYAETNPALDVEGYDAKYKLCIILAHAFGLFIKPENIFQQGIQNLSEFDIRIARQKGCKIKLVASCRKINDRVVALVCPQWVNSSHHLSNVENEFNGVVVEGVFSEKQFFAGKGAGSYPTGSAVLSDISALTYDYKYEYKKLQQYLNLYYSTDALLEVYVRFAHEELINMNDFESISESCSTNTWNYIMGKISLKKLLNARWLKHPEVSLLMTDRIDLKENNKAFEH